jgi:hypothetical protein
LLATLGDRGRPLLPSTTRLARGDGAAFATGASTDASCVCSCARRAAPCFVLFSEHLYKKKNKNANTTFALKVAVSALPGRVFARLFQMQLQLVSCTRPKTPSLSIYARHHQRIELRLLFHIIYQTALVKHAVAQRTRRAHTCATKRMPARSFYRLKKSLWFIKKVNKGNNKKK